MDLVANLRDNAGMGGDVEFTVGTTTKMMDVAHTMAEVTAIRSPVTANVAAENLGKSRWVISESSFAEKLQELDDMIGDDVSLTADFPEMESTKDNGETAEIKIQNLGGKVK